MISQFFYDPDQKDPLYLLKIARMVGDQPFGDASALIISSCEYFNYRSVNMPTDWLGFQFAEKAPFISSVLPKQFQRTFIALDLNKESSFKGLEIPSSKHILSTQVGYIKMIERHPVSSLCSKIQRVAELGDLPEQVWAIQAATENRVVDLETEMRQLELYWNELRHNVLTPIWNFDQELIDLFAILWRISVQKLPLKKQLLGLKQVRQGLQFFKASNLSNARRRVSLKYIPRDIAQCIMLCDNCCILLADVNNNFLVSSLRASVTFSANQESLEQLVEYLQELRDLHEQNETNISDLLECENQFYKLEEQSIKSLNIRSLLLSDDRGLNSFEEGIQNGYDALNECIGK